MKKIAFTILSISLWPALFGQNDASQLNLERIYSSGEFRSDWFGQLRWFEEGESYTTLTKNESTNGLDLIKTDTKSGQTETLVRQMVTGDKTAKPKRPPLTAHDKAMLARFESKLGTRIELNRAEEETGKLVIHFYSKEELQAIFNAILGNDEQL